MKLTCSRIKISVFYFWLIFIYTQINNLQAQSKYLGDFHMGRLLFIGNTIKVDPGPNWMGYYLNNASAYILNTSHGLLWKGVFFTGVGVEYQQFHGKYGFSGFAKLSTQVYNKKISINGSLKIGYSHLWNQYPNGTGTMYLAPELGVVWEVPERIAFELTTGPTWMQQSLLWSLGLGFRF